MTFVNITSHHWKSFKALINETPALAMTGLITHKIVSIEKYRMVMKMPQILNSINNSINNFISESILLSCV